MSTSIYYYVYFYYKGRDRTDKELFCYDYTYFLSYKRQVRLSQVDCMMCVIALHFV
jgi:hypothetical protein